MEPISVALLAALAGSVGGEAGRDAWQGLVALVRRPFRRGDADASTGEAELTALAASPGDETRAHVLSTALAVRAALDAEFRRELEEWRVRAQEGVREGGGTYNTISGGEFNGTVIMGRDVRVDGRPAQE
ncbi:hypothetical protein ABZX85_05255 [Streptomyces sp. NPDC004539]|uniref:hypothetical protein n=1 Tax=Streptomyces sp. NPDC004539 TaxID=3154280 RepID=UPI0033B0FC19